MPPRLPDYTLSIAHRALTWSMYRGPLTAAVITLHRHASSPVHPSLSHLPNLGANEAKATRCSSGPGLRPGSPEAGDLQFNVMAQFDHTHKEGRE
ncbi:hypothetical protein NL676_026391 [Syzygium grande]|nr:hypothetical protein NL676_026391 [Syzygium grande]